MVRVEHLTIKIRGQEILSDISLCLEDGKIYALLGENGSGKTTLLRALTSYYPDYSGSIDFDGRELRTLKRKEKEMAHAILPQNIPILDSSVSSLLSMYPEALKHLEKYGLLSLLERRINTLSGGEREMVFLSFLLSRRVKLYALDEVEANLGMHYKRRCEEAMLSLKGDGGIVISSFHDLNRAFLIADEAIVLEKGRLVFAGSKGEFISQNIAQRYFDSSVGVLSELSGKERIVFF